MREQPSLRFDHREIAVIFSLFVFVSLLMFTVGILVGKGLAQARYESMLMTQRHQTAAEVPAAASSHSAEAPEINHAPAQHEPEKTAPVEAKAVAPDIEKAERTLSTAEAKVQAPAEAKAEAKNGGPLKLIPQRGRQPDLYGNTLAESGQGGKEAEHILKNPKLKQLFDDETPAQKRTTASVPKSASNSAPKKFPPSLAQGNFTVQVGSYPTEKDAAERVTALKELGFQHAYFTAKELGEKKDTWYRVWLGYYSDLQTAQRSGEMLQEKGEVKNYLVRKTDSEN